MKGRLMIWCENCTKEMGKNFFFYSTEDKFSNHCPKCKSLLTRRKCTRCGHEWTPRGSGLARVCPNKDCCNPYWCRERIRRKQDE